MPFRVIPNIFAQSTHPLGVPPYPNFGLLISRAELETTVRELQTSNPSKGYKVLYIQRHGQGVHNVAEELYGTSVKTTRTGNIDHAGLTLEYRSGIATTLR